MTHLCPTKMISPPIKSASKSSVQTPASTLRRVALSATFLLLTGCGITSNPNDPNLVPLPEVDSANAVTLKIRSKFNSAPLKHHHILRVDGARVAKYEQDDRDTLLLTPGNHLISISCHTVNEVTNTFPANYRVSDANASLNIEAYAGESICLGIGFELLNCAVLEERESTYCD